MHLLRFAAIRCVGLRGTHVSVLQTLLAGTVARKTLNPTLRMSGGYMQPILLLNHFLKLLQIK